MPCAIRRSERNWFHQHWFCSLSSRAAEKAALKTLPKKQKRCPLVWRGLSARHRVLPSWLRLTSRPAMPLEWRSVFGIPWASGMTRVGQGARPVLGCDTKRNPWWDGLKRTTG